MYNVILIQQCNQQRHLDYMLLSLIYIDKRTVKDALSIGLSIDRKRRFIAEFTSEPQNLAKPKSQDIIMKGKLTQGFAVAICGPHSQNNESRSWGIIGGSLVPRLVNKLIKLTYNLGYAYSCVSSHLMLLDTAILGKGNHHILDETTAQTVHRRCRRHINSSLKTWAFNNERLICVIS